MKGAMFARVSAFEETFEATFEGTKSFGDWAMISLGHFLHSSGIYIGGRSKHDKTYLLLL
jgi:hypothetical protein